MAGNDDGEADGQSVETFALRSSWIPPCSAPTNCQSQRKDRLYDEGSQGIDSGSRLDGDRLTGDVPTESECEDAAGNLGRDVGSEVLRIQLLL